MDELDKAKELEMQQREEALRNVLSQPDHGINEQPWIEDGVRLCLDCGDPIPLMRLKIRPDAVRCVDCKTVWEKKNK